MALLTLNNLEVRNMPPREAEALAHTAIGHSAKEAARSMGLSSRTVEDYLNSAMHRLGVRNRYQLITQAFATGVLRVRENAALLLLCCLLSVASVSDMATADPNHFLRARTGSVRVVRTNTRNNSRKNLPEPVL